MRRFATFTCLAAGAALLLCGTASAADYLQDFDSNIDDWTAWDSNLTWNSGPGTMTIGGPSDLIGGGTDTGAYTFFDGPQSSFGSGFTASVDVYLDPTSWTVGEGFDYSVALYQANGSHAQDFIFHVGVEAGGDLLINASNNSSFAVIDTKLENNNGGHNYDVNAAGWYTLEHVFRTDGSSASGYAVDFNVYDSNGLVYTVARDVGLAQIPNGIGGHGYGWFTFQSVDAGLEIDNASITYGAAPVPEPATMALLGLGLAGIAAARRKSRKNDA